MAHLYIEKNSYAEGYSWWVSESRGLYTKFWYTNNYGSGVFITDSKNFFQERQLVGTAQFTVKGMKDPKGAIRRWMKKYYNVESWDDIVD